MKNLDFFPNPAYKKYFSRSNVPEEIIGKKFFSEGVEICGIRYYNVNVVDFEGFVYVVSHKAILTINTSPVCNAQCKFCYNGITFFPNRINQDRFKRDLERVIRFCKISGIKNVSISGGEPTLDIPFLVHILKAISPLTGFKRIHSNGSKLFESFTMESHEDILINHLAELGITDISLSRVHFDSKINSSVMGLSLRDCLTDDQVSHVASKVNLRLSCFIHGDSIYSDKDILDYYNWGISNGVKRFVFRLSTDLPAETRLENQFWSGNKSFENTTESILNLFPTFKVTFSRKDVDYDLYTLRDGDIDVSIDRSSDVDDPDSKIRRLILMSDGLLFSSWVNSASTVFPTERDRIIENSKKKVSLRGRYPAAISRLPFSKTPEKYQIDLHCHTSASDGEASVEKLINNAAKAGIKKLVITDHNCLHDSSDGIKIFASHLDIDIPFQGIEASVDFVNPSNETKLRFHILVYAKIFSKDFVELVQRANLAEKDHINEVYSDLPEHIKSQIPSLNQIYQTDQSGSFPSKIYQFRRTPLARAISNATGQDIRQVKQRLVPKISHAKKYTEGVDAATLIKEAAKRGYVTSLAHPSWVRGTKAGVKANFDDVIDAIVSLRSIGLNGVECSHRHNDKESEAILRNLALDMDLIQTGGSDYHGKSRCEFGSHGTTVENLERIEKLLLQNRG